MNSTEKGFIKNQVAQVLKFVQKGHIHLRATEKAYGRHVTAYVRNRLCAQALLRIAIKDMRGFSRVPRIQTYAPYRELHERLISLRDGLKKYPIRGSMIMQVSKRR